MAGKRFGYILGAVGVLVLLSTWGDVADWTEKVLRGEQRVRDKKVVYWTSSGSPEVDLKRARQFEQKYPDTRIRPHFRETGGLQDILFVSFLSGNPPDYMSVTANELRQFVLIGGVMPLDDLIEEEAGGVEEYLSQFTESARVGRLYRFNVNPEDRFLETDEKGNFLHPKEAARLLRLNGKIIGYRDVAMPSTVTYNKRLFRAAAKMFPEAGLVDDDGEPIPPKTWVEFYQKAKLLTEYGKRAAAEQGKNEPICYGVVLQGQRPHDIMRGIEPLAYRAGSMAFTFQGDSETVHQYFEDPEVRKKYAGRPLGYFDYDSPAFLAAFALLKKMDRDGFVLPGTASRHYEDVRTALASGKAAMVIDGWHAALIGAERVPWAAQDLGSAPVPTPYHDPNAPGWTAEKVEQEKQRLYELLELEEVGIELPPGNRMPRTAEEKITFFTSLCRYPRATWKWTHFAQENVEIVKADTRRGTIRTELVATKHRGDPEWFPYPYQEQVYQILEDHCSMWPERPSHGPVNPANSDSVFFKYFYQRDIQDLSEIVKRARQEVREFTTAVNRDYARRIEQGIVRPARYTFPEFDPTDSQYYFKRQQQLGTTEEVAEALGRKEKEFVSFAKEAGRSELVDEAGSGVADEVWKFERTSSPLQILWIPGLMVAVFGVWALSRGAKNKAAGRPLTAGIDAAKQGWHGYAFALPGMLAIFAFAIYPSIYQFFLAAHSGNGLGPMQYVGGANFNQILNPWAENFDAVFWVKVVPNTLAYMIVVTGGKMAIGLALASLLNLPLRANRIYRVLFFIPLATSLAIVSVILIGLLKGEDSGLNQLIQSLNLPQWIEVGFMTAEGKPINWLGEDLGLFTIMAVGIWHGLPYFIILLLAGLQSIDPQLYEAAKVDGAGAWRRFWNVTIPEILPILIVVSFQAFIGAARAFSLVFVLTEGGVDHSSELVATYIFKKGFMKPAGQEPDLGYASALGITYSVMLALLTVTNVVIIVRRWRRRIEAERKGAAPRVAEGKVQPMATGVRNV